MRNNDSVNFNSEQVITGSDNSASFLPRPGEHEARNLANVALNTEKFSPDEIVSVNENPDNMSPIVPREIPNVKKTEQSVESNVVKIITTDRDIKNEELNDIMHISSEVENGKMSPFDFAQKIRGSLEDSTGGKVL